MDYPTFYPDWATQFAREGILVLENFFDAQTRQRLVDEATALIDQAFFKTVYGNAYLKDSAPDLPADHCLNLNEETTVGVIAYDQLSPNSCLRAIYQDPQFHQLIERILNRGPLYRYDCELGAINIAVMRPGDYLRWHFDQSDFVVSIPLQEADQGGIYEYVRNIKDESNPQYEAVKAIIQGQNPRAIQALHTPPGSLIFFEGRHTLHRVTPIAGEQIRLVALLGYADRSGVKSDPYLRQIRYGR